jgi:hypothetical protein
LVPFGRIGIGLLLLLRRDSAREEFGSFWKDWDLFVAFFEKTFCKRRAFSFADGALS